MITIIDYHMGNVSSVYNALHAIGREVKVSHRTEDIRNAHHLILPGVGAFAEGMKNLRSLGLIEPLYEEVIVNKKPLLGICLGMQLLARDGYEGGYYQGLGWLPATVKRLATTHGALRLPHMGWNEVTVTPGSILFEGIQQDFNFYFVHSYHLVSDDPSLIEAICEYGTTLTAAIRKDNIFATQFHPEKSHGNGLQLLRNFTNYGVTEKKMLDAIPVKDIIRNAMSDDRLFGKRAQERC